MAVADKLVNLEDLKAAYDTQYNIIAAEWSSSTTYNAGDYCIYNGKLWRCKLDGVSGSNNAPSSGDNWVASPSINQLKIVRENIAPRFDESETYAVGDYVSWGRDIYRCSVAVTSAGPWTGTGNGGNWTKLTSGIAGQIKATIEEIAEAWSSSKTYKTGDYVSYNRKFFRSKENGNQGLVPEEGTRWHELPDISNDLVHKIDIVETRITNNLMYEIAKKAEIQNSTETGVDLDISDNNGNVIARFSNGHIQTKEFDSRETKNPSIQDSTETGVDLDISDNDGNVILRLAGGHIQTKEFDSRKSETGNSVIQNSTETGVDLDISDNNGNVIARFSNGQFETKYFNSLRFADVKAFGAIGDGETDDTEALESAMAYGFANDVPVRFTAGTYLIRRPLTLRSNMEIYGTGNAIIKSKASFTTRLTAACEEGDETITVASTTGFKIGDPIAISYNSTGEAAARHCSVGYITGKTSTTVTFESAYDSVKIGAIRNHEVGCYVSNACAIFRSWGTFYACDNVYIHNLTLNGNRQNGEWADWFAGCIHVDASTDTVEGIPYTYSQSNPTFRDLTIINSHFDGISDQGSGGGTVENCKIFNPKWHGVHFGTTYSSANVLNNTIKNTENGAGVFWCAGAKDIVVEGNRISGCNKGCSDYEYGTAGNKSIINGNIFINITSYVFDFSLGDMTDQGTIIITDNIIESPSSIIARFKKRKKVIFSSNIIEALQSGIVSLFDCANSDQLTFVGNICPDTETTIISGSPTNVVNSLNSWN